jgi:nucleoside-diphosphate kinase
MNRTLAILKPDCVSRGLIGDVLQRIENDGFHIIAMKMVDLTPNQAQLFYREHRERSFFNKLVAFMTETPVVVAVLEKENAVEAFRTLTGATDPAEAAQGTIRQAHAEDVTRNTVHGSDSDQSAVREIHFFFGEMELVRR